MERNLTHDELILQIRNAEYFGSYIQKENILLK